MLASQLHPAGVHAQTARDVDCRKCVDTGDVAKKAAVSRTIKKGAVTTSRIAKGAVGAAALAEGAVTSAKITDGAVTEATIPGGAVTTAKIAADAVGAAEIVDGAVTEAKLATGAVTTDALVDGGTPGSALTTGAVEAAKLREDAITGPAIVPNAVASGKLAPGAVGPAKLAAGAVTNDRLAIAAVIADKIAARSIVAENFAPGVLDTGSGLRLLRTIVIGPLSGGTDTCDDLIGTLDRITDAASDNPYLIKLEAGTFDCGTDTVRMKPYVDIEGSGEDATVLRGSSDGISGVVRVSAFAELRFLRVENDNDGAETTAVRCNTGARMTPRDRTGREWRGQRVRRPHHGHGGASPRHGQGERRDLCGRHPEQRRRNAADPRDGDRERHAGVQGRPDRSERRHDDHPQFRLQWLPGDFSQRRRDGEPRRVPA